MSNNPIWSLIIMAAHIGGGSAAAIVMWSDHPFLALWAAIAGLLIALYRMERTWPHLFA